jgi:hypothetical protein
MTICVSVTLGVAANAVVTKLMHTSRVAKNFIVVSKGQARETPAVTA